MLLAWPSNLQACILQVRPDLIHRLTSLAAQLSECSAAEVVWALARLNCRDCRTLLSSLASNLQTSRASLQPADVALAVWGFGALRLEPDGGVMAALLQQVSPCKSVQGFVL